MKKIICIFALAVLIVAPARARLGETEDQCVARYGAVLSKSTFDTAGQSLPMLIFMKNGYGFGIVMMDGKAVGTYIQKSDKTALSDNELDLFLAAESAGQKWTKQPIISATTVWMRDDGARAEYNPFEFNLMIASKELIAATEKAQAADEAKKTSGF